MEIKGGNKPVPPEVSTVELPFLCPVLEILVIRVYFNGILHVFQEHTPVFKHSDVHKELLVVGVAISLGGVVGA